MRAQLLHSIVCLILPDDQFRKYTTVQEQYDSLNIKPKNSITKAYGTPQVIYLFQE